MKTVYAEDLLLLNTCINYLLLLETARLCSVPYRRGRYALSAVLGAVWCCAGLLPSMSILNRPAMAAVLLGLMVLIAFGRERRIFACAVGFIGISAMFGGGVYAACLLRGRCLPPGRLIHADAGILVLSFALCRVLISPLLSRRADPEQPPLCRITVERNGKTVCLTALRDTGNRLYDPMTGCAALLAEAGAVAPLFTKEEYAALCRDGPDALVSVPGLRLISCTCFDGQRHLLTAFRPDRVTVDGQERSDLLAALLPAGYRQNGTYQAIL